MIETMSNATNYNFISNNVKGIPASKKRLKLFEYLKQNISFNGFILFQETHFSFNNEKQWKDEFTCPLFSHTEKQILAVLQLDFVVMNISNQYL